MPMLHGPNMKGTIKHQFQQETVNGGQNVPFPGELQSFWDNLSNEAAPLESGIKDKDLKMFRI